jgi:hypothetical protein
MAMAPANYSGLANLMNLQGVGVNPTSQLAYVPSKDLMTRYQTIPNPSTGIPQAMGVTGMAEGGMPSQQYPMQEEAMELANRGRYGDTTLVQKSLLPIIGGIAGSIILPGLGTALGSGLGATAIGSGLGTAAGGLLAGQKPGEALLGGVTSGILSFGIGSILSTATPGLTEIAPDVAYGTTALGTEAGEAALSAASVDDFFELGGLPTVSGAPTVGQTVSQAVPDIIAPVSYSAAGVPQLTSPAVDLASASGQELLKPTFSLEKAYEPSALGKLIGKEAIPAGPVTREQFIQLGGIPSDATFKEIALQKAKQPLTYARLGAAALTGEFDKPYKEPEPEKRPPAEIREYELVGGERLYPTETSEEIMKRLQKGGVRPPSFSPYEYNFLGTRTAAAGGIVGLQHQQWLVC